MTSPSKEISTPITDTPTRQEDRNRWYWGFTPQAENWNGRFAMIGFVAALITELVSNQGFLHYWNLVQTVSPPLQ
jgi:Chlorophyll A-B binding protein